MTSLQTNKNQVSSRNESTLLPGDKSPKLKTLCIMLMLLRQRIYNSVLRISSLAVVHMGFAVSERLQPNNFFA